MMVLIIVCLICLLSQCGFVIWNIIAIPKMGAIDGQRESVHLSVCIPVRNEERNIEACLESILNQSHVPSEIIIVDDQSTDATKNIIKHYEEKYPALIQYVKGQELPEGWKGKVYACHQLGELATSEWLLFIDADVRLQQDAIEKLTPHLTRQKQGIISGFPRQIVGTWLERLLVPMMAYLIYTHLPIAYVQKSTNPIFAAAHGGFIAIHRHTYNKIGGHETIKDAMVDDMALFKRVKAYHDPALLLKIDRYVYMRMYHTPKEVIEGYAKNSYHGINKNNLLLIGICSYYLFLYLLPVVGLMMNGSVRILSMICIGIAILTKAIVDKVNRLSIIHSLFIAVSSIFVIGLLVYAASQSYVKKGYTWKGRHYE